MSSQRQLVITTLKALTRECLREQTRLHMVMQKKGAIEAQEQVLRNRIRLLKLRTDRELTANKELLGIVPMLDDDGDGEEWKA